MFKPYSIEGREYWESRSLGELEDRTDQELGAALRDYFGLRDYVRWMRKRDKIGYIQSPDIRPTIQAEADERKGEAAARRQERRDSVQRAASQFDRRSKLRAIEILPEPFIDSVAGINARRGVRVIRISDGEMFDLSHQVASTLERRGVLSSYGTLRRDAERDRRSGKM